MNQRRLIDTNLIVRYLVQDHVKHAEAASRLFAACDRGEIILICLPVVLAECVFVLESFYEKPRADISRWLSELITSPGIELTDAEEYLDALKRYRSSKLHFIDCIIAAYAAVDKIPIATFDSGFKNFDDVRVDIS